MLRHRMKSSFSLLSTQELQISISVTSSSFLPFMGTLDKVAHDKVHVGDAGHTRVSSSARTNDVLTCFTLFPRTSDFFPT